MATVQLNRVNTQSQKKYKIEDGECSARLFISRKEGVPQDNIVILDAETKSVIQDDHVTLSQMGHSISYFIRDTVHVSTVKEDFEHSLSDLDLAFPFLSAPYNSQFFCPEWPKAIIHRSTNLQNVDSIIRYFNHGVNEGLGEDPYKDKISHLIIEDLMIQAMHQAEYDRYIEANSSSGGIKRIRVEFVNCHGTKDGYLKEITTKTVKIAQNESILVLKRILLRKIQKTFQRAMPFFLEFFMNNDDVIDTLLAKNDESIKVFLNLDVFDITLHNKDLQMDVAAKMITVASQVKSLQDVIRKCSDEKYQYSDVQIFDQQGVKFSDTNQIIADRAITRFSKLTFKYSYLTFHLLNGDQDLYLSITDFGKSNFKEYIRKHVKYPGEYDAFSVVETQSGTLVKEHNIEEIFKGEPKEFTLCPLVSKGQVSFKFDLQVLGISPEELHLTIEFKVDTQEDMTALDFVQLVNSQFLNNLAQKIKGKYRQHMDLIWKCVNAQKQEQLFSSFDWFKQLTEMDDKMYLNEADIDRQLQGIKNTLSIDKQSGDLTIQEIGIENLDEFVCKAEIINANLNDSSVYDGSLTVPFKGAPARIIFDVQLPDYLDINYPSSQFRVGGEHKVQEILYQVIEKYQLPLKFAFLKHKGRVLEPLDLISKHFGGCEEVELDLELTDCIAKINVCNKKSLWFTYDKSSVVTDLADSINYQDIKDLHSLFSLENFQANSKQYLLFTYNGSYVSDNQKLILLKKPDEKQFLYFEVIVRPMINLTKKEYVVSDNVRAKEMVFVVNSNLKMQQKDRETQAEINSNTVQQLNPLTRMFKKRPELEKSENRLQSVREEIKAIDKDFQISIDQILNEFNYLESLDLPDLEMESLDAYRILLKVYTSECVYREINDAFTYGRFAQIEDYLSSLMRNHQNFSKMSLEIQLKEYGKPVYRGVQDNKVDLADYEVYSVKQWPRLVSTTKNQAKALSFCMHDFSVMKQLVLFHIYLCDQNEPITHVDLSNEGWSFSTQEEEIILLPYFKFQVVSQHKVFNDEFNRDCVIITIAELPQQNVLSQNTVEDYLKIFWYDSNGKNSQNEMNLYHCNNDQILREVFKTDYSGLVTSLDEFHNKIQKQILTVLIVSGSDLEILWANEQFLETYSGLKGIFVFCYDVKKYGELFDDCQLIQMIDTDIGRIIEKSQEFMAKVKSQEI